MKRECQNLWIIGLILISTDSWAQCPAIGLSSGGQNLSNLAVSSSYNPESEELYVSGFFDQETFTIGGQTIDGVALDVPLIYDLYLMKLTPDLEVDWLMQTGKSFNIPTSSRLCVTDGGVLAAFQFVDTVTFASQEFIIEGGGFHENALFMKIDQQGDIEWIYRLSEVGTSQVNAIDVDKNGIIYLVGTYTDELEIQGQSLTVANTQTADGEMFIAKFNPNGNLIWLKHLGGGELNDKAYSLSCRDDGLFVSGFFHGDLSIGNSDFSSIAGADGFVASLDTAGNVGWAIQLSGSDDVRNEEVIPFKGGCLVSGFFLSSLTVGSMSVMSTSSISDFFVLRLYKNGNPAWLKSVGGDGGERMLRLETVNDDLFMVSGSSTSSFSVDGFSYVNHASTQGAENGIVLLVDSAGTVRCLSEMPSTHGSATMVEYLGGDTIAMVGAFTEDLSIQNLSFSIDGTSSVVIKTCMGCEELIRLDAPAIGKPENALTLAPNLATATVQIKLSGLRPEGMTVTDMLGRAVRPPIIAKAGSSTVSMDVSHLPPGMYAVTVTAENGQRLTQKLVVGRH